MVKFGPIHHDIEPLLPQLVRMLEQDPDIVFAFLFGSRARGKVTPLSDVDIAVYLSPDYPEVHYTDKTLDLMEMASGCLNTSEVDIVILNGAPPELAYRVLKDGRLLLNKDNILLIRFKVSTLNKYLDRAHMRHIYETYLIRRIKEGRFGA